jgi:hypothetical protein
MARHKWDVRYNFAKCELCGLKRMWDHIRKSKRSSRPVIDEYYVTKTGRKFESSKTPPCPTED